MMKVYTAGVCKLITAIITDILSIYILYIM